MNPEFIERVHSLEMIADKSITGQTRSVNEEKTAFAIS